MRIELSGIADTVRSYGGVVEYPGYDLPLWVGFVRHCGRGPLLQQGIDFVGALRKRDCAIAFRSVGCTPCTIGRAAAGLVVNPGGRAILAGGVSLRGNLICSKTIRQCIFKTLDTVHVFLDLDLFRTSRSSLTSSTCADLPRSVYIPSSSMIYGVISTTSSVLTLLMALFENSKPRPGTSPSTGHSFACLYITAPDEPANEYRPAAFNQHAGRYFSRCLIRNTVVRYRAVTDLGMYVQQNTALPVDRGSYPEYDTGLEKLR